MANHRCFLLHLKNVDRIIWMTTLIHLEQYWMFVLFVSGSAREEKKQQNWSITWHSNEHTIVFGWLDVTTRNQFRFGQSLEHWQKIVQGTWFDIQTHLMHCPLSFPQQDNWRSLDCGSSDIHLMFSLLMGVIPRSEPLEGSVSVTLRTHVLYPCKKKTQKIRLYSIFLWLEID